MAPRQSGGAMAFGYQQATEMDTAVRDEPIRALREFFTSEEMKHMGRRDFVGD
jgi:hypothetical protein